MSYDISTTRWKMLQFKLTTSISELCHDLPGNFKSSILLSLLSLLIHQIEIFQHYFRIVRSLGFYETPNYDFLISLFQSIRT